MERNHLAIKRLTIFRVCISITLKMVNYLYHNALRATMIVTAALLFEKSVVKTEEACSVTGLILRHLVDGVMDSIVVELLCLGSDG